jgi:ABC-2 type transport system permease protein
MAANIQHPRADQPAAVQAAAAHRLLKPNTKDSRLSGFGNMFSKEMGDWFHTRRWWTQLTVWFAIINLLMAFILFAAPQIDIAQGGSAPGADEQAATGVQIFFTFAVTGGTIGVIIIALDEIVGEKTTGTAAWILSKPLSRVSFVLTKLASDTIGILLFTLLIPGIIAYFEIWLASGQLIPVLPFLTGIAITALTLFFYLTLTIMLGVLFDSRGPVVGISMAVLFLGQILSQLVQQAALILPVAMQNFATMAASGDALPQAGQIEILTTAIWSLVFMVVAVWRFTKLEM